MTEFPFRGENPPNPDFLPYGLLVNQTSKLRGTVQYERPAYLQGHRLKDCQVGAFAFFNAAGDTSVYRTRLGRYSQIGEGSVIGPPEHPTDWFSSHPYAFTRPRYMPGIYLLPDFERLAPGELEDPGFVATVPNLTVIGHEAYIGAGTFIKRGVTIGDGALIGARSVVTRDVPPYAVMVGSPARLLRLRFAEKFVERFLKLQWWRYDLAPFKQRVDFSKVEATLDFFEERLALGELQPLRPDTYQISVGGERARIKPLDKPLFFA
ncbi:CatB-related O-acetyltransferase [Solimonas marina]|uniref:CatB-related O-acetyltransferase n=1 Tax=Solimonas marina TaxID=2714601 RepID=A0A969W8F9_9GAMM|nr:CatB-related O-acetyltransferase [Solimonas marina]NKF21408.1 CatB-related O-acetyltransferase [Solimonas marina]